MHYPAPTGYTTGELTAPGAPRLRITQNVTRAQTRACLTHVALICDNTSIQPQLPQVILGNEHILSVTAVLALEEQLPKNVRLWRRPSGWVNKTIMRDLVRELVPVLRPYSKEYQPVLLLDSCSVHMDTAFLKECTAAGIWVVFIPAKMTWLMQPLDTHVFARYKRFLAAKYHRAVIDNPEGVVDTIEMIRTIGQAVRYVLQKHEWKMSMVQNVFLEPGSSRFGPAFSRCCNGRYCHQCRHICLIITSSRCCFQGSGNCRWRICWHATDECAELYSKLIALASSQPLRRIHGQDDCAAPAETRSYQLHSPQAPHQSPQHPLPFQLRRLRNVGQWRQRRAALRSRRRFIVGCRSAGRCFLGGIQRSRRARDARRTFPRRACSRRICPHQ